MIECFFPEGWSYEQEHQSHSWQYETHKCHTFGKWKALHLSPPTKCPWVPLISKGTSNI
jgi:hypothetical protein